MTDGGLTVLCIRGGGRCGLPGKTGGADCQCTGDIWWPAYAQLGLAGENGRTGLKGDMAGPTTPGGVKGLAGIGMIGFIGDIIGL